MHCVCIIKVPIQPLFIVNAITIYDDNCLQILADLREHLICQNVAISPPQRLGIYVRSNGVWWAYLWIVNHLHFWGVDKSDNLFITRQSILNKILSDLQLLILFFSNNWRHSTHILVKPHYKFSDLPKLQYFYDFTLYPIWADLGAF